MARGQEPAPTLDAASRSVTSRSEPRSRRSSGRGCRRRCALAGLAACEAGDQAGSLGARPGDARAFLPVALPGDDGAGADDAGDLGDAREQDLYLLLGVHDEMRAGCDGRRGVPPPTPPARVGDNGEAVQHAPGACRPQCRGPLQQHRPRPVPLRAQPLVVRTPAFPPLSTVPAAFFRPARLLLRIPALRLARASSRSAARRTTSSSASAIARRQHRACETGQATGLPAVKRCQILLVLAGSRCTARDVTRPHKPAFRPVTSSNGRPHCAGPPLITVGNENRPAVRCALARTPAPERKPSAVASPEGP
jgi:hypothetical protein